MVRSLILVSLGLCALWASASADRPPYKNSGIYEEEVPVPVVSDVGSASDEVGIVPAQAVDERYRLPKTSIPIHYTLYLRTDIHRNERTFSGSVGIQLQVLETTDKLVLHNRGLVISSARVSSLPNGVTGAPSPIGDAQYSTDTTFEHITFTSPTILQPGTYLLEVSFEGRLATNDDGFYVSSYVADNGERRYLATTQFESTSARMAFPCYDEPGLKATFSVAITHSRNYNAISNMPEKDRLDIEDNMRTTEFQKTPVMSSYLLAFVVSDFLFRVQGTQRVYVRPNAFNEATFALEAGNKILKVLDEHLDIPYDSFMPKLDQIAVPDFAAGAMENWGLVTYREQALLFNPAVSTYRTKTNVATTIAHELAHQWFGDLVSPEWWEYIWLNEGFATLYEFYALHLAYPEQEYWELFNTQVIQYAMGPDSQASTRPMNWNAATPNEIAALFDRVAYDKSGSVLNMMRHVLGDEYWRAGLKIYLNERAYQGAVDEQLYEGLQKAIEGKGVLPDGVTVGQIMRTWTNEAGYPVLTVRRSYDTGDVIISQERFYADRKVPNSNIWMIPYNYVHQARADFNEFDDFEWLATKAARLQTTVPANEWIIFNKQQVGYYRVNYDDRNWELITNALIDNWGSIHRLNRAQLIDDAYWLARSGRLDMRVALRFMTYLRNEREYAPWTAANVALSYFNNRLRGTPEYHNFLIFVDALIENIYGALTIDSVSPNDTLLHKYLVQTISTWACSIGYIDCLEKMGALLTAEATGTGPAVHPDIASVAYCYGMRSAGETEFQYLYRKMMDSKNLAERTVLIDSLGCSNNKEFLKALLMTALGSGTGVEINYRNDERRRVVQAVYSGGRTGVDALIEFLMDPALASEFVSMLTTSTLNSALSAIASRTNNVEELNMLNDLITALDARVTSQTATNLRNTAQANIDWVNGFEGLMLSNFLSEFVTESQMTTTAAPEPTSTTTAPVTTTTAPSGGTTTTTRPTTTAAMTTTVQTTTATDDDDGAATVGLSIAALLVSITHTKIVTATVDRHQQPGHLDRSKLRLPMYKQFSEQGARELSPYRLPNDTVPESYVLELSSSIHEQDFSYSGSVVIRIRVLQTTRTVVLHSMRSRLLDVEIRNSNQLRIPIVTTEEDSELETLTIRTGYELQRGIYQLTIRFENTLRSDAAGFYRTSYNNGNDVRYSAVTQFQPVDARTAFPCFDEPGIRATFTISITSGVETKVYSNMPIRSVTIVGNGLKQTLFQTTPSMPTYLVAFAITNGFASSRVSLKGPPSSINMELIAPSTVTDSAQTYGIDVGSVIIRTVEQYFNQPYGLPKLDQLAVPDFYFAAMENWGLVIYEERYLLYDELTSTNRDKENVIATVVHEFVHQFLGNLLTPHWWSDLSLSEGFATFYEYYLSSLVEPNIRFMEKFTVEALQAALLLDSDINIRPISYDVQKRSDIELMFDIISYQKGGSIFRMFHYAFGEATFQKGIQRYISENKGRSVTPADLFESLQAVVTEDVKLPLSFDVATLMSSWIFQSGYPLVTVTLQNDELTFKQEHFLDRGSTTTSDRTWWIPITYSVQSDGTVQPTQFWMPQGTTQLSVVVENLSDNFILVNPHQTGYYRVNYDENLWMRLITALTSDPSAVSPVSRGQLMDDCFKLYYSGRVDANILYSLLSYVESEIDAIPWTVALANDNLGVLQGALVVEPLAYDAFSRFASALMANVFSSVGFDALPTDAHETQQLRSIVIEWSCRLGLRECRTEALTRMLNDFSGSAPLPSYLKYSVYCGGATIASPSELETLWLRLQSVTSLGERIDIIEALACSENEQFLDSFLDTVLTNPTPGEWEIILTAVYQKSSAGYEAFDRWLNRNTMEILQ
uniref:Aminopeptidase N n=1 Tax=Anopheles epiroticus TaxID=199890 RepID=A0A182PNX7_9DIPT